MGSNPFKQKRPRLPAPPDPIDPNIAVKKKALAIKKRKEALAQRGRQSTILTKSSAGFAEAPNVRKKKLGGGT